MAEGLRVGHRIDINRLAGALDYAQNLRAPTTGSIGTKPVFMTLSLLYVVGANGITRCLIRLRLVN